MRRARSCVLRVTNHFLLLAVRDVRCSVAFCVTLHVVQFLTSAFPRHKKDFLSKEASALLSTRFCTFRIQLEITMAEPLREYLWIAVLGGILGFVYGFLIGANDVANAFASSISSRSITLKQAVSKFIDIRS